MWKRRVKSYLLANPIIGGGEMVMEWRTAAQQDTKKVSYLQPPLFIIELHLSSCLKCLTLFCLWVCDNWCGHWLSCEYWLRQLHTAISKSDSFSSLFSLWRRGVSSECGKHRNGLFCLSLPSDATLIRITKPLQIPIFMLDAFWCGLNLTYGELDVIYPHMSTCS